MSTDTATSTITEAPPATPDPGNPVVLGVPCAVIGVAALGLFLLGFAPTGAAGALVPLFLALGVGLFIAARWAITAGIGPVGGIFGVFGAFFWSFALLYIGFVNNWYGTKAPDSGGAALTDTFLVFTLCWAVGGAVLVLATLRLPLSVWLILLFSELVFVFVFFAFLTDTFASGGILRTLGGVSCIGAVLAGACVYYGAMSAGVGGKEMPMGRPLMS